MMQRSLPKYFRLATAAVVACLFLSHSAVAIPVAEDDFELNSTSGGTGWADPWAISGSGGFVSGAGKIDGDHSLGLFGNSNALRQIAPTLDETGTRVSLSFSIRADWDVRNSFSGGEIGVNVLDGSSATLLTFKFVDGIDELRLNDGGGDFSRSGITFAEGDIYDFYFESDIGSSQYSFTVDRRGSSETDSGTNFGYSGRTTSTFGGLQFFVNAPGGSGNDGFIDSVVAVPEPSAFLFGSLVCSVIGLQYSRRRR